MKNRKRKLSCKKFEYVPIYDRLKTRTYKQICQRINGDFKFLQEHILINDSSFKIQENQRLSQKGWELIKGLYYQKIKQRRKNSDPKFQREGKSYPIHTTKSIRAILSGLPGNGKRK
jgi:hypothetical protein